MLWRLCVFAALTASWIGLIQTTALGETRVVGYFRAWATNDYPYTKVDYSQLTHIAHAFVWPMTNGTLNVPDYFFYPELVTVAHAHGVKIVVSVGGGSKSIHFPMMANDPVARSNFVQQLTAFCVSNKYDGADYDWEAPASATDMTNFTSLVRETRAAFDAAKPHMSVSAAVKRTASNGQWLDVGQLRNYLDWFGVMTYNFHTTSSRHSGYSAPLYPAPGEPHGPTYCVDAAVRYYLDRGVARTNLLMGFVFHGYQYASTNLYATNTLASASMYSNVVNNLSNGWTRVWDSAAMVPYLVDPNHTQLITYDDPQSMRYKCEYAVKQGLGGTIIWALGQDTYTGSTNELLRLIGKELLHAGNASATSTNRVAKEK